MQNIIKSDDFFITSDTWFGRPAILDIANRTSFKNIDIMNKSMFKKWNSVVKSSDTVLHLGNFAWDPVIARQALNKLNGKIFLIKGNCDDSLNEIAHEFPDKLTIINDNIIKLSKHDIVASHWPLLIWEGRETGTIHLHGHTVYSYKTNLNESNRINCCCDYWSYAPIKYSMINDFVNGNI